MTFLSRARKFLQGLAAEPESKVQYFNVICASGHRVRGERTEGYQALRCPACGDGVFVLPRSPLPEPFAPARPQSAKHGGAGGGWIQEGPVELAEASRVSVEVGDDETASNGAEIIWEDVADEYMAESASSTDDRDPAAAEPEVERSPPPAAKPAARARDGRTPESPARPQSRARQLDNLGQRRGRDHAEAESADQRQPESRGRRSVRRAGSTVHDRSPAPEAGAVIEPRPASRRRSLPMVILIAVPLLVVITIAWRIHRNRLQEYPLDAEAGRLKGIPALDEGDFDKAYQLLSAAKTAVDALGGAVEDAEAIRGAASEAEVFVNLCSRSLEDLLTEAGRTSPDVWQSRFDALYKGQYVIFDTHILAQPSSGPSAAYAIEYVVFPVGEASSFRRSDLAKPERFGRIDLTHFQLFELARPQTGDRVTFAAKLAGFEYDGDQWRIRLEPKSGVYITHTKALETLGWPSIPETESPVEAQP